MSEVQDADGTAIKVGDRVVQLAITDPSKGAFAANAKHKGSVVGIGRTRVEVLFDGRTKFQHKIGTDEPVTDKVSAEYLLVIKDEQMPENVTIFRG